MSAIAEIARDVTVLFPVHPRTRPSVLQSAHAAALVSESRLRLLEPLGYHEFIGLMDEARRCSPIQAAPRRRAPPSGSPA